MKVTKETFPKEWDPLLLSELVEKADITLDRGEAQILCHQCLWNASCK